MKDFMAYVCLKFGDVYAESEQAMNDITKSLENL